MFRKHLFAMIVVISMALMSIPPSLAWNAQAPTSSILIFVSFSMPKESLRGWLSQASKIKAPVVIRGLVHNSFRETTNAVMEILPDHHGGFQLDPTLFKRFNIEKVPAVVVTSPGCLADQSCHNFNVIYGDVTLDYALKQLIKQEDELAPSAESALKQLNEKGA